MERLTMRDAGGRAFWVSPNHLGGGYRLTKDPEDAIRLDRLAAAEDAMHLLKNYRTAQTETEGGPLTGEKTYIDRDTALNAFRLWFERIGTRPSLADVETLFEQIPTADAAPVRHGQWDGEGDGYAGTEAGEQLLVIDVWYCSECGYYIDEGIDDETILPNYCPNCGAKMDKEETHN